MAKTYFKLSTGDLTQDWGNGSLITANNDWSNVPSIEGFQGVGMTGATGVNPTTLTGDPTTLTTQVFANQTNPNTFTSGGVAEFQLAGGDTVVALQGSGTGAAPFVAFYLDASGREKVTFSLDLRDIDGSADNAIQQIAVQYRIGESGAWTNVTPNGYVADASTGPNLATAVTHLDLTLPGAVDNQSQVQVRVMTTNAVSNDEWIGIDNIKFSSSAMGADLTPPALTASTPADGAVGIAAGANLVLKFSELVALGTGNITITDGAADTRVIDVTDASQVSLSGQTLTINPAADLNLGTTYHVSLEAGTVKDLAGNAYAGTGANPVDFSTIAPLTRIYEIQGAGHTSAFAGKLVNTQGVVTAIDTNGSKGFWIQDMTGDGNAATSDGIFVFSSSGSATVKIGDLVSLQGTVDEYAGSNANNLTTTEIKDVSGLTVISSGNTVASTILGADGRMAPTEVIDSDHFASFNPEHDAIDFYESLEGMLVQVESATVISTTYQSATWILPDAGSSATNANDRGSVTRAENDVNPERIQIYSDNGVNGQSGIVNDNFIPGDNLGNVTGVMHYFGGNFELVPTTTLNVVSHTTIALETTTLQGDTAHMTVGAYNVENLDPNDAPAKWAALGHDIAIGLKAPDVLGVEEIQDSNGTGTGVLDATVTLQKLVDSIVAAGGPQYAWVVINPTTENSNGGEPNGNIRTAILYNPARVSYVDGSAKLLEDISPANGDSFHNSRKPLAADFTFHGETVTYIGVHNYSRLGSDELFGKDQPPVNSGDTRRTDQTSAVLDFVQKLKAANPDANVVVAGDFNGYHYETAQTQLESGGLLKNMVWTLDAADRYSSAFEGQNEQIDQLFLSSNVAGSAVFDNVHLNTNQAYGTRPSDHDAVLSKVLFNHGPVSVADLVAAAEDLLFTADAAHGVLANDTDLNNDTLSATLVSGPAHGTLHLNADGSFDYQAVANYNGTDSFSYVAKDAFGGQSAVMTVQIGVAAVNDAPVAQGESAAVAEDASVRIDVLANDSDVDLDALTIVLGGAKSALGASISIDHGQVVYSADADSFDLLAAGASVADSFTYYVTDGHGGNSAPVTVNVKVSEAGDNRVLNGSNKADDFTDAAGKDSTYFGGNGEDKLNGGDGADILYGDNGNDTVYGGDGADQLFGGNGADLLFGGAGHNVLTGGNGPDTFAIAGGAVDTVTDFRVEDAIVTGYAASGEAAVAFVFADSADGVVITGGALGTGSVTLQDWTVAQLVGHHLLSANGQVIGDWLI